MDTSEKAANERASQQLVAHMSLETMFPDPQSRALAKAAGKGQIRKLNALVEQGVDVNTRGAGNATPLFWALRNIKGFERLLQLGANPDVVFNDGGSVMHWAVGKPNTAFLVSALRHGGNPDLVGTIRQETPLFAAMGPDNKNKLSVLLAAGADMNFQAKNGETPMMVAAGLGQFDTVFALLELGADYQLKNSYNDGTLMDEIAFSRRTIDPKSDGGRWMEKVIDWLAKRGVEIPEWKDPGKK